MADIVKLNRRDFLKISAMAGGGLLLGVYLPDYPKALAGPPLQPNVFVRIDTDEAIAIWVGKADMGQGVRTSLPMIVADELDADWSKVRVIQADAHPNKYGRQITVGSGSVRGGAWNLLRQAGATGRAMLKTAAAARWGVAAGECTTEDGYVIHEASGRKLSYGDVTEAAAKLDVPENVALKDKADFTLTGKNLHQVDTAAKVTGESEFGIDVRVPNMRFATVVHCPVFGGSVGSFDATKALEVTGVDEVVELSTGIAVVADNTWAAFKGASLLDIEWDEGDFSMSSRDIFDSFERLSLDDGAVAMNEGDASLALEGAARRVEAKYEAPYLAHATMEPMNCTADVRADHCEVWAPTQNPQGTQGTAARLSGFPSDQVTVHVTHLGCGWGRRSRTDFVEDAVLTSKRSVAPFRSSGLVKRTCSTIFTGPPPR